jgi:hypothetical protein
VAISSTSLVSGVLVTTDARGVGEGEGYGMGERPGETCVRSLLVSLALGSINTDRGERTMGTKTTKKKSRSGTSRTYAQRAAAGRPNVTLSLTSEVVALLAELAEHLRLSRSAVVDLALRELAKKKRR